MRNVTDEFVKFALEYADYDKIPAEVIHESKRVLLDGLGNALGGIASDKGKIGIMFARRQGSNGAASLIGVGGNLPRLWRLSAMRSCGTAWIWTLCPMCRPS